MASQSDSNDAVSILEQEDNQFIKDFLSDFNFVYTRFGIVRDTSGEIEDFVYESTNGAWEELSGKKEKDVYGLSFKKHSKFGANIKEWIAETYKSITSNTLVTFVQYIDAYASHYRVRLKYSSSDKIVVTYTDITYLSETETRIREVNRNFEALFENTQTAVIQSKLIRGKKDRLKVIKANQASIQLLECNEIQKGHFLDGCNSGKYLQDIFFKEYTNDNEDTKPFTFFHKPLKRHLRVAHYRTGDDVIVLSILDVSEEVRKSEVVEQARKRYEDLIQNLDQPFVHLKVVVDNNGKPKDLIYLTINKTHENIFDRPAANILGKSFRTVIKDEEHQKWKLDVMSKTVLQGVKQSKIRYAPELNRFLKYNIFPVAEMEVAFTVEDITESLEAETKMKAANQRFNLAADLLKLSISELNLRENRTESHNQNWIDLFDLDPKNALNEFESRIHKDDLRAVGTALLSHIKDKTESYQLTYRFWNKEFSKFKWIHSNTKVIEWAEDGSPLKILTVANDISHLKTTEAEFQRVNKRLNTALDLNQVAIWEWNVETDQIESYTKNWEEIYGFHTGKISEYFKEIVHPEDLPRITQDNIRLYKGEIDSSELEFRIIHSPDKQEKWVRNVSKVLKKDENGRTLTLLGYSMDITSHKLHEINEVKSNNRLKIAINNNKTAIYEWNIQTGETISKNEYWQTLYDFDPKKNAIKQFAGRVFEEDKVSLMQQVQDVRDGIKLHFDSIYRLWDNEKRTYKWITESARITEFDEVGKPKILLAAATDITQQKDQEENERRANDRLNIALISNKTAVYEWDIQDDKMLYHSHYWNELYGYDKDRALIPQFMDRVHEEDRERMINSMTENQTSEATNFQNSYRLWNEERTAYKWISDSSRVIEFDKLGNPKVLLGAATDITLEKQKEMEVKDISRELTRAQSIARVGSWQWDQKTQEINWSLEIYKLLGFDPKSGVPSLEDQKAAYTKESWTKMTQKFEEALQIGDDVDLTLELSESRRPIQWVQTIGNIVTDDNGRVIGLRGTTQDITSKKNAEDQLREEMQFSTSITENSYPSLYIYNYQEQRYTYANKGFEVIMGWSKDEILSMPVEDHRLLIHKNDFQKFDKHTDLLKESKLEQSIQYRLRHKAGHWVECLVTEVPYEYDETGNVTSCLGSIADITEIINAYEQLEKEKQFRDSITESTTSGIYIYDVEKGKNLYSNKGTAQILGFEKDDLQNMSSEEFAARFHPEDISHVDQHIKELVTKKKPRPIIYRFKHKLGHFITCYSLDSPYEIDDKGRVTSYIGTFVDISEMQHAQEELIKAKNVAEKANRQKDLFLANMSHEIRTPMNAVLGFSKLLKKEGLPPYKRESYIYQIENNSHQLMELIDDILNITQIENGQIKFNHSLVALDRLIDDILEVQRVNIEKKGEGQKLQLVFAPSKDLWLEIDKVRLSQIINNLLTNAIKYSDKGTIEIGYFIEDDRLNIYVKDQGKGIKKSDQKGVFERFAQTDEKLNTQTGGIGLGLSIARSLTNLLGGRLKLESKYQKGSTFTIMLPLEYCQDFEHTHDHNISNPEEQKLRDKIDGKTIIVADDNEAVRFFYEEILSDYNINLYMAENGLEAVKLVKQYPEVDLVLMDIRMPKMDGVEALEQIRKFNPGIVVVAQSAFAMEEQINEFRKQGFFDYITKPLQDENILEIIAKAT